MCCCLFLVSFKIFANPVSNHLEKLFPSKVQLQNTVVKLQNIGQKNQVTQHGTGVFVENYLLTNFHVIAELLEEIVLEDIQIIKNRDITSLKISQIVALSPLHDLALLKVEDFEKPNLSIKETSLRSEHNTFVMGYGADGNFQQIMTIGKRQFIDGNTFGVLMDIQPGERTWGLSGSPLIINGRQIAGLLSVNLGGNFVAVVNGQTINDFLNKNIGVHCDIIQDPKDCVHKAMEDLSQQAEVLALAKFRLAMMYLYGNLDYIIKDQENIDKAIELLEQSSGQNYAPAQHYMSKVYSDNKGFKQASHLIREASEKNFLPSQIVMIRDQLSKGESRESISKTRYWYNRACDQVGKCTDLQSYLSFSPFLFQQLFDLGIVRKP